MNTNYTTLASEEILQKTSEALTEHNFQIQVLQNKEEALEVIKKLIPEGASVMNGASKTLEAIGYIEYLKSGDHSWNNLHEKVLEEKDPQKQSLLRRQSVVSDFYIGSAHAVTETGEIVIASNTGSQLSHSAFTSPNIILVIGTQKITPTLQDAFKRIEEHVIPLEDARMKEVYGFGTTWAKTLILHKENPNMGRKVRVLLVKESLGF